MIKESAAPTIFPSLFTDAEENVSYGLEEVIEDPVFEYFARPVALFDKSLERLMFYGHLILW